MSTLSTTLNRQLARTVQLTGQLKQHPNRSRFMTRVLETLDFTARGVFHVWRNRQYLTIVKLINMGLVNLQFKFKTERVIGRPYKMKIESTNICNTNCQLCPTGIGLQGRQKGKMSFEQYKKLINQFRRYLTSLDLSMWGDPLIVPDIYRMIKYAHDRGVWTYISSNLHAFKPNKGHAEQLINSGLDMLTCSLHGASQETFEIYQPGKKFDEAIEKIKCIIDTRTRLRSTTPDIQLNFVVTRHNEHEKQAFQKLANKLGATAVFSSPALNVRFLGQNKKLQSLRLAPDLIEKKTTQYLLEWLPNNSDYVLQPYRNMLRGNTNTSQFNGHKPMDCSWPWRQSVINWDGQVVTCCGSFDPKEDIGNIFEQPFAKIWNNAKYRMARRSFKHKITDEQAKDNPCANCPGFML